MFVTESRIKIKTASLFLLFPAVQSCIPNCWEIDPNISGLVERLTTKEGVDELRKVLDKQETSTEMLSTGSVIYPDFFELENNLPLEKLLELLEPDMARRPNIFDDKNQHFGGMHRAYFKVTSENVVAGAVNMIYENNKVYFTSIEETNYSEYKNSFVSLIYERVSRTILFIGIINNNIEQPEVSKRRAQRYFVEHK
ncbi:serpin b3 [Lasius niger]|uniref:Serpin b3 n=1 Tax=Lasius niger TaxID=67767 RepID=A0A0J7KDG2_LASNI|nr:serpin b3 [Lasius niger]